MKPLNIVMLAAHACVRVQKEALCLLEKGHRVHLIALDTPSFVESYRTFTKCFSIEQFLDSVKVYCNVADIFHAHNEPSWFVSAVKEVCDKPVVIDVHDSFLTRLTNEEEDENMAKGKRRIRIQTEERNNFQIADGLVFPSKIFGQAIREEFKLSQPYIDLPPYIPEHLYCYNTKEWLGGIVYEGRVDLQKEVDSDDKLYGFRYCIYEDFARECSRLGVDFHLQVVRKDKEFMEAYNDIAFVHPPVGIDKLLSRLSRHDWGLVGNIYPSREWDVAMPNKLFEYIGACLPVVAMNSKSCAEFVKEYGIGIVVDSVEELARRWSEHTKCRERLIKIRRQFTMNNHIHKLEELYGKLLD